MAASMVAFTGHVNQAILVAFMVQIVICQSNAITIFLVGYITCQSNTVVAFMAATCSNDSWEILG